jgi:plastocyanin
VTDFLARRILAAALGLLLCDGAVARQVVAAPNEIGIANFAFMPGTLTVAPGTSVTWINHDEEPHAVRSVEKSQPFKSPALDTDDKFTAVFDNPGTYKYICSVHPNMEGTIVVK